MGLHASHSIMLFSFCTWSEYFVCPMLYAICLPLCTSSRTFTPSLGTDTNRALFLLHTDSRTLMPLLDQSSHTCPLNDTDVFSQLHLPAPASAPLRYIATRSCTSTLVASRSYSSGRLRFAGRSFPSSIEHLRCSLSDKDQIMMSSR